MCRPMSLLQKPSSNSINNLLLNQIENANEKKKSSLKKHTERYWRIYPYETRTVCLFGDEQ